MAVVVRVLLIAGFPLSVGLDVAVSGAGSIMLGIAWAPAGYMLLSWSKGATAPLAGKTLW